MAETLGGAKPKKPRQKPLSERQAEAEAPDNVVQLPNVPSEELLAQTLLNGVADLRKFDDKIAAKMAEVKNLRADRKGVVAKLGAAGLPASLIKEAMDDADKLDLQSEQAEKEKARAFIRKTFGLATADWSSAFDGLPTGAKEELDAEAAGHLAGVMAADRQVPDNIPPERGQDWLKGYDAVMEKRAMKFGKSSDADAAFH